MGFVGNYRERGDERREDVIKALSEHVSLLQWLLHCRKCENLSVCVPVGYFGGGMAFGRGCYHRLLAFLHQCCSSWCHNSQD
ncbi:hypothetical protein QNH14_08385 [Apirhabdus apintestini]|nr:hypothetical protein QNH14_08385 [Enterobacteriaceae bacterium CA-0114]